MPWHRSGRTGLPGRLLATLTCSAGRYHEGACWEKDPHVSESIFLHLPLPRTHRSMRDYCGSVSSQLSCFWGMLMFHGVTPGAETQAKEATMGTLTLKRFPTTLYPIFSCPLLFWALQASLDPFSFSSYLLLLNHPLFLHPFNPQVRQTEADSQQACWFTHQWVRGCFTGPSTSSCERSVMIQSSHALRLFAAGSPVVSKWIQKFFMDEPLKTEMDR